MVSSASALMQHGDGWYDHMNGWGGGWMWLWGTLMMLSWVLIIAVALWAVQRAGESRSKSTSNARAILEERFARGEIDADEYRHRLEHLS